MSDFAAEPADPAGRLAARCGSDTLRLEPEWAAILRWMRQFGRVVARVENEHASLSTTGRFSRPVPHSGTRVFVGGEIALACRLEQWQSIFATIDETGRRALCLFDVAGQPIATIEVSDRAGRSAFDEMVWRLHAVDQSPFERVRASALAIVPERERALRRTGPRRARQVGVAFVRSLLAKIVARNGELTCALGNPGATHVHAGALVGFGGIARWTASFASRATLSIDAAAIARAWIVEPFRPGDPRSIELFGERGEPIVTLAGSFG